MMQITQIENDIPYEQLRIVIVARAIDKNVF